MNVSHYSDLPPAPTEAQPEYWIDGAGNRNRSTTAPRFAGSPEARTAIALEHLLVEQQRTRKVLERQAVAQERTVDLMQKQLTVWARIAESLHYHVEVGDEQGD